MDACMHAYINAYENIRMNYCQKLPFIVDTSVRRRIFKLKKCSIRLLERFREAEILGLCVPLDLLGLAAPQGRRAALSGAVLLVSSS